MGLHLAGRPPTHRSSRTWSRLLRQVRSQFTFLRQISQHLIHLGASLRRCRLPCLVRCRTWQLEQH